MNLKSSKNKTTRYNKKTPIRLLAYFSVETKAGGNCITYSKWWKGNLQSNIFYVARRISFRTEGDIKGFPEKQKLSGFITTKPALQEMLKGFPFFFIYTYVYFYYFCCFHHHYPLIPPSPSPHPFSHNHHMSLYPWVLSLFVHSNPLNNSLYPKPRAVSLLPIYGFVSIFLWV